MKRLFILVLMAGQLFAVQDVLKMEDFLQVAVKNNPAIINILAEKGLISPNYIVDKEQEDLEFSVGLGNTFLISGSDLYNPELTFSASKFLLGTGTTFTGSYTRTQTSTNQDQQKYALGIEQPLLRNSFGYKFWLEEKARVLNIYLTQLEIMERYEDYLLSLINDYYDWYSLSLEENSAEGLVNDYRKLLEDILDRKSNYIAREIDVNKVKLQLLEKEDNLLLRQNELKNMAENILGEMYLSETGLVVPSFPLITKSNKDLFSFQETISRTDEQLLVESQISSLSVLIAEDDLSPEVSLDGEISYTHYPSGSASSIKKAYVGLGIGFPFSDNKELAAAEVAKLGTLIFIREQSKFKRDRSINLQQLKRSIELEEKHIVLGEKKISLLTSIAKDEKADYLLGKSTLNALIQALINLENANNNLTKHKIALDKLKWQWLAETDQLLQFI